MLSTLWNQCSHPGEVVLAMLLGWEFQDLQSGFQVGLMCNLEGHLRADHVILGGRVLWFGGNATVAWMRNCVHSENSAHCKLLHQM